MEPQSPGAPGQGGGRERRLDLQRERGQRGDRQHRPRPHCYQGDQDGQKSWRHRKWD